MGHAWDQHEQSRGSDRAEPRVCPCRGVLRREGAHSHLWSNFILVLTAILSPKGPGKTALDKGCRPPGSHSASQGPPGVATHRLRVLMWVPGAVRLGAGWGTREATRKPSEMAL